MDALDPTAGGDRGGGSGQVLVAALQKESELRGLTEAPGVARRARHADDCQTRAERRQRADQELSNLRSAREQTARALASAQADVEAEVARAAAAERTAVAQEAARHEAERARVRASSKADEAQAELRHAQSLLEASVWCSGSDQRVAAVRSLRADGGEIATRVHGFLCEVLSVDPAHARAVCALQLRTERAVRSHACIA